MKVSFNLSKNYIECQDEAKGIAFHRKKILKSKKNQYLSYFEETTITFIIILMLGIFTINMAYSIYTSLYGIFIIYIDTFYLLLNIFLIYKEYNYRKKHNFINKLIIDEKGITDIASFKNIEILFKWPRITGIVVGNTSVVVLTDTRIFFYADIKDKDKLIKLIKEYKNNILIIE